jgi:hypothetical protein
MASTSIPTPTTTTTKKRLQFFHWRGWDAESYDSHSFGMIAFSKEQAVSLILERLHQVKGAQMYRSAIDADLKQQQILSSDRPKLPLPSVPNMVNCQGPFTAGPDGFLNMFKLKGDKGALTLQEYLTTTDPKIYPVELGLAFFTSALQG